MRRTTFAHAAIALALSGAAAFAAGSDYRPRDAVSLQSVKLTRTKAGKRRSVTAAAAKRASAKRKHQQRHRATKPQKAAQRRSPNGGSR